MRQFTATFPIRGLLLLTPALLCLAQRPSVNSSNPFSSPSPLPFHAPPFNHIKDSDYQPAIEAGISEALEEIRTIANNPAPPDFDNTIVPLLKSGDLLERAASAFYCVAGANTNPGLQKTEEAVSPKLAALNDATYLDPKLFTRIKAIHEKLPALSLGAEAKRAVEVYYSEFLRAGANLDEDGKARLKQINEQLSTLTTRFDHQLLAAANAAAFSTTNKS